MPHNMLMFEILLSTPNADESLAEEWNQKRLYAMKKVLPFLPCIYVYLRVIPQSIAGGLNRKSPRAGSATRRWQP